MQSPYARAGSLGVLALLARDRGELARAAGLTAESLALFWVIGEQWSLVTTLESAAAVMGAAGEAAAAARLYGTVAALRDALSFPLAGCWLAEYERCLSAVRSALDAPVFRRAWGEGAAMPLADAVAAARDTLETLAGS